MKVILISPPLLSEGPTMLLPQPLGLASIGASLRSDGHQVLIIDSLALGNGKSFPLTINGQTFFRVGLDYSEIAKLVPKDAEVIGLSAPFTHHSHIIKPLISALRKECGDIRIILGGVYPSTLPVHASRMGADYVAVGEGEPIMTAFAGGEAVENINGLYESKYLSSLKSDNIPNRSAGVVENLDSLPFPDRSLLPFDAYIKSKMSGRGKNKFGASIHTSRGCPYACSFCSVHSVFQRRYRARSAENVWLEMREIMDKYRVFNFEFEDDNLTLIRDRAVKLFGRMADWNNNNEQKITFITPNGIRIDTLDEELLLLIKKAGCQRISLALEHGDPEMLELMNKKLKLEKVEQVIYDCKKIGIKIMIYLIIGYPGENKARWRKGLNFVKKLQKIDKSISFNISLAKALPETQLLNLCIDKGYLSGDDPNEMVLLGNYSNISTPDFTPEDLQERLKKTINILEQKNIIINGIRKFKKMLMQKR
ncbi:MAG: radical SAM protein [Candidatus Falkowbacteria bacterium]|nr:B12-binding domain-containing radical SAM protein [Candidatus Parcubacteria bacterium]